VKHKLTYSQVARESSVSRQHIYRVRTGKMDLTIMAALRIRDACGRLVGRRVGIAEVFEVD
jgi:predicted transcriptional regulator